MGQRKLAATGCSDTSDEVPNINANIEGDIEERERDLHHFEHF